MRYKKYVTKNLQFLEHNFILNFQYPRLNKHVFVRIRAHLITAEFHSLVLDFSCSAVCEKPGPPMMALIKRSATSYSILRRTVELAYI